MLISTKMHPPQLKANLLERQHLIDHLAAGSQSQLMMITGPAGYGKTSLALQWINQHNPQIAWYSVDESDNDPDLFFRYLMTALVNGGSRLKKALSHLLHDGNPITPDDAIPAIIHALSTLPEDFYVVLDDYHLVTEDGIHLALARLLKYLPPKIHVFIISRHMLPRTLHHFKYECDFAEITVQDLKFSEKETEHFFKQVIPLELAHQQIRVLNRITRGWVTGCQIFGLWQRNRKIMEQPRGLFKITSSESVDYLINDVVKSQPEKIKTFLYQTAGLNRFDADMCRHVTGSEDAGKILVDLHRHHLFIIPLDPEHTWYRYHHLFSEALREWVKMASPSLLEQTRKKAAVWCVKNRHMEEAFQYARAAGDFEFFADLLEGYLFHIIHKLEFVSSLRWLSKLPQDVFLKRPLLRLMECDIEILRLQLSDKDTILADIEAQLASDPMDDMSRHMFAKDYLTHLKTHLKMTMDCIKNMHDVDIEQVKAVIKEISKRNKSIADHMSIMMVVRFYAFRGDFLSAEKEIKRVWHDIFSSDNIQDQIICMALLADIERTRGRLTRAENLLSDGFDLLKQQKLTNAPIANLLYRSLAHICFLRNDIDKSLDYATRCLTQAERIGLADTVFTDYYLLCSLWIAKGDLKKARHYAQKCKILSDSLEHPIITDMSDILLLIVSIHQGNRDALEQWASQYKPDPLPQLPIRHITETILFALSMTYKGKLAEAADILEDIRQFGAQRELHSYVLETDIFLSGIYFLMNKKDRAKKIMESVICFSEKDGHLRLFVIYAGLIHPLLEELRNDPNPIYHSDFFQKVIQACTPRNKDSVVEENPVPKNPYDLTERELEILRFISNGYQNKQIADMAFISLSTVKTHIQHILKKLDVTSRTQAALKAKAFLYSR